MPSTTLTRRYYPTLSTIVSPDDLPEVLGILGDGIANLLGKIHYKDLQYSNSAKGDSAFYSLSIINKKRLDIRIPHEIFLILNPDSNDGNISSFPITIAYEWKILSYLRGFDLSSFSFSPDQIFELALKVLNISKKEALAHFIDIFVEPANPDTTPLQQFVTDINADHLLSIPATTNSTTLPEVIKEMYSQSGGTYSSTLAFGTYAVGANDSETKEKLKKYFQSLIPARSADKTLFFLSAENKNGYLNFRPVR